MRRVVAASVLALSTLASLTACEDAKSPDPGPPDAGMSTPSSLSSTTPANASGDHPVATAAAAAESGGVPMGDSGAPEKTYPPVGPQVKVTFGGKESSVTVAELPQTAGAIALPALIKKALPNQDPAALKYDLVGSDGFHVGSRPACSRPLTGAEIATGKLDATTHNVTYDAASTLPGCYRVHAVVKIDVTK